MANNKVTEMVKQKAKVKITGSASTPPRLSSSMIKSQPVTTSKAKPKAAPMTPEDKAMFKLLQKKYPDLYPKK